MLLKHVELSKEDADVIHQSVLEVDETASKDLRSNARRRTCTGSANQSAQANRGSAAQAMIASTMQGPAQGQQTKDARTAIRRHAVTGNDCETQGAREI